MAYSVNLIRVILFKVSQKCNFFLYYLLYMGKTVNFVDEPI